MAQKSPTSVTRRTPAQKKPATKKAAAARRAGTKSKRAVTPPPKRYRFHRPIEHRGPVPSIWQLTKTSVGIIRRNLGLFIGITLIYTLLSLILVQGLTSANNASSLKSTFEHLVHGQFSTFISSLGVFAILVGSAATTSGPTAGPYQLILALITSLAIIWALRQLVSSTTRPRLREAYYRGMYPLIPFILVLILMCIQLIPFIIGGRIYATVITNGLAAHLLEKILWFLLFVVLALWSLYMITSSAFALYIVTLPDMPPMRAIRSARDLVRYRRWTLLRKILGLPLILLIIAAIIMLPVILIAAPAAAWIFFLLSMAALVAIHVYMYTLYRELLNE